MMREKAWGYGEREEGRERKAEGNKGAQRKEGVESG